MRRRRASPHHAAPAAKPVAETPEYIAPWDKQPATARPFLGWSITCPRTGAAAKVAEAMLQVAWAADDAGDMPAAHTWRSEAAAHWGESVDAGPGKQVVGALRCAGAFDRAATLGQQLLIRSPDPDATRILRFQLARMAGRDTGRHAIASALPPPARDTWAPYATALRETACRLFGG